MIIVVRLLLLCGFLCLTFAAWGLYVPAGHAYFDEMAGIIPLLSGVFGLFMVGIALMLALILWLRCRTE